MTRDLEAKARALALLGVNFGKPVEGGLLALWLELLEPYTAAQVLAAVKKVISGYLYKTVPPFAVLKKHLDEQTGAVEPELKAMSEWDRLCDLIHEYGTYQEPPLHPTTAFVLRTLGGWDAACLWQTSELPFRRKEFIEAFAACDGKVAALEGGALAIEERRALALAPSKACAAEALERRPGGLLAGKNFSCRAGVFTVAAVRGSGLVREEQSN